MRFIYIALGFIFAGLGALGVALPLLPTTPFLLVAAFFFGRASRRLHAWFKGTGLYKRHLESYVQERAMTVKTKVFLLGLTSAILLVPFVMMNNIWGRAVIVAVLALKYWYFLFKIRTIRPAALSADNSEQKP